MFYERREKNGIGKLQKKKKGGMEVKEREGRGVRRNGGELVSERARPCNR